MYEKVPESDTELVLVPWKRNSTHRLVEHVCNAMIVVLSIAICVLMVIVLLNVGGIASQYTKGFWR